MGVILLPQIGQGTAQMQGKGGVLQWLQDIIQCVDRIALDGVLGQIGNENDNDPGINAANLPGRLHSVEKGHFHVQKEQIILRLVLLHQIFPVVIAGNLKYLAGLPAEIMEELLQLRGVQRVVLCDDNAYHNTISHKKYARFPCKPSAPDIFLNLTIPIADSPMTVFYWIESV